MSFGSGGFGFGQSNTTQQPSAFGGGGFGSANTGSAFGQNNSSTTFGANNNTNSGGGLFGGGAASTSGFGSTGSAFGSNNNSSAFGANKTAFGTTGTTSGGLFGGASNATTTPSAFGGFGSSTTAAPATSAFGGGSSLFGASKPATTGAFGSSATGTTGGSLFGGSSTTGGGFGSTAGGAFGASNNPGIGTNIGEPPGTNTVAFQPTVEKEVNNSSQQNSFQNILFQDAYKKWSAEELRLVDYNQGRRFGNATGTGAFGVNSSFGSGGGFGTNTNTGGTGFGTNSTGGGLFGNNNAQTTTSAFSQPATTGGFGSGGGGLFGGQQNKPTTGGLFGSNNTQPAAQSGGLFGASSTSGFGTSNNASTGGGFGSNTTAAGGGGLFGGGANANANKPGGFGFGTQQSTTGTTGGAFGSTGTGFGAGSASGTSLFGNNNNQQAQQQGGGLFGNSSQANTGSAFGGGGAFGGQNQQQGTSSLFGGQNKPTGGLFGTSTATNSTGGGLFGNTNTTTSTGAFGNTNNNQTGVGLFGAAKPAVTGGGLFGNSASTQQGTTGGGLFGNAGSASQNQQQSTVGGSLFGGSLGQNQSKPSLFGNSQGTGGSMFGNTNQQQQGGGLFGSSQQQSTMGNSLFANSQNQAQPQALTTSLADMSAFGTSSLFAGVGANDIQNPGPLATPLSSAKKQPARASILPIYRLSKPQTPKRGFGFSYSTYGSPATPSSANSTPGGFGQSLLAGSLGRSLNKSISTSSLRRSFNAEDSILAPGAFSASVGPRNHGSMGRTKLVINRDIRSDLFSTPSKDRHPPELVNPRKVKRVSFDPSTATAAIEQGESIPSEEIASGSAEDLGYLRPTNRMTNGANGTSQSANSDAGPDMEQVKGNELAIVHEEESPQRPLGSNGADSSASDYWMSPSKEEIQNMNRVQRQKVTDFTVGRHGIGHVKFRVPVDLSSINLDEIFIELVQFSPRSCTVYPNPAKKPTMGKGLNVPAEITLENSWPRGREKPGSRGHQKHIERLKRIPDTEFVDYNAETGVWVFRVEHFTTYGLDDDDDDGDDDTEMNSVPNQPGDQPGFQSHTRQSQASDLAAMATDCSYNNVNRTQRHVPGAFDPASEVMDEVVSDHRLSVRSPSPTTTSDSASDDLAADYVQDHVDLEMTVEDNLESPEAAMAQVTLHGSTYPVADSVSIIGAPAGIMRARMRAIKESTAPARYEVTGGDDWMEILKKSVNSGRPRDRAALKNSQELAAKKIPEQASREKSGSKRVVSDGRGFATSIDLMNSLFGKDKVSGAADGVAFVQPAKSFIKVGDNVVF